MAQIDQATAKPPVAKKAPKADTIHGDTRIDAYYWMRDRSNPDLIAYLEAENAYSSALTGPTDLLRRKLYAEMIGRIRENDSSVPYRAGQYSYYARAERGKQYAIYCRKRDDDAAEEITLDLNELTNGHEYLSLGAYTVSDDARLLAYSIDTTGTGQYILHIKDLCIGQLLSKRVERVRHSIWANDSQTIFYTVEDPITRRCNQFFRHVLGGDGDEVLYEEEDESYNLEVKRSRDRRFIILTSGSEDSTEVRFLQANQPNGRLRLVLPREPDHKYYVDSHGDRFYIRTNRRLKRFSLMTAPASEPREENWNAFVTPRAEVKLDGIDLFANHCVIAERANGLQYVSIVDLRNGQSHRLQFSEPVYAVAAAANPEFNTNMFRFSYQSQLTPVSVFDYNMDTREQTLLKRFQAPSGYDASQYTSERIFATLRDGTCIPISVAYKSGLQRSGQNPLLLLGYGAYGLSIPTLFSSARVSLFDRGVICAIAHVRGGGEMGEEWHDSGKLMSKHNTFTDFIEVAEHLIKEKYTSKQKLVIEGDSAGGLLMAAVTNMRPDLFRAVVLRVPFLDILNTMLDAKLPFTVGEYLEWGDPNDPKTYEYIKSYSPYDNIQAKEYPAMLVKSSFNDTLVMYWEPAKYVAKLRAAKTDANLLLLKTDMNAGHGGLSGRYNALKEKAFDYAFILSQMGIME